ncbi:MAG: ABC transporter substrate-binding protein [Actinomycetota bacterium]
MSSSACRGSRIVAIAALALVVACSSSDESTQEGASPTPAASTSPAITTSAPTTEHASTEPPITPASTAADSALDPAAAPTSAPSDTVFPIEIEHRFGSTTLSDEPQRVVTVGLTDHDAVLALGVVPVGVTQWLAEPIGSWAVDRVGDDPPAVVGTAAEINFEAIAATDPDVIFAVHSGLDAEEYELLSAIAPTIAQPPGAIDYGVSWDTQTEIVGEALGRSEVAAQLVADLEAQVSSVADSSPTLDGAVGVIASPLGQQQVSIITANDPRGALLARLGIDQPPEIVDIAGNDYNAVVSFERADLIDGDFVIWLVNSVDTDRALFEASPLYTALDVSAGGHDLYIEGGSDLGAALSFVSVLSIPVLIDELVPQITAAIAGT